MFVLQVNANNVRGKVNGAKIQCIFKATLPAVTARSTSRSIGVINGAYNSSKFIFPTRDIKPCVFSQILD